MSRRQRRARDVATRLKVVRAQVLRRRARRRGAKPAAATTAAVLTIAGVGVPPAMAITADPDASVQNPAPGAPTGRTAVSGASTGGAHTTRPSDPRGLVAFRGWVYFSADDGVHGTELWRSDGTRAGTVLVRDIDPGVGGSNPVDLTAVGGRLFFSADDGTRGRELWGSDGTRAGTVLVRNIKVSGPGKSSDPGSRPGDLTAVGDRLFFSADDGTRGRELWKSDGTRAGTVLVRNIKVGGLGTRSDPGSAPDRLTAFEGRLFFSADDGIRGRELWKSDGTRTGTALVRNIKISGPSTGSNSGSSPGEMTAVGDRLFFAADDGTRGRELWKSDGTRAGTALVRDIRVSGASTGSNSGSSPGDLTAVGNRLFFSADDGTRGRELWRSDGTRAGTALVRDIRVSGPSTGSNSGSSPGDLTAVGNRLFFSANDGARGRELWRSDGTKAGTVLVKNLRTVKDEDNFKGGFRAGSYPSDLTTVGDTLFFTAGDDDGHGHELWKSDGTRAGTVLVKNIKTFTGHDFNGAYYGSYPDDLTPLGGRLFFAAEEYEHGRELWRSDGTAAGTVLVKDVDPTYSPYYLGPGYSSSPGDLTAVGRRLFFAADDGTHGRELWRSDGTGASTILVKDINAETG